MVEPEIELAPWDAQAAQDAPLYLEQIAYLFDALALLSRQARRRGFRFARAMSAASTPSRRCRSPRKTNCGSRAAREQPIGTHCTAAREEIVRIYSTSGTTGTPSYIPLTASDLEVWVRTSARSYAASGLTRGERIVSTYNAGPFVAGAALGAFDRLGLCHIPVGTGNTERLMAAVDLLKPTVAAMTPSYALHLAEWARQRGMDLARSSVKRRDGGGRAGRRRTCHARPARGGLGRQRHRGDGHRRHLGFALGRMRGQGGHAFQRPRLRAFRVDRSRRAAAALRIADGATGELVLTHLVNRSTPLLRFRTRDHVRLSVGACACGRTAPRVRCIGRTDDMLIVRGVNVFPSAVREVVNEFAPDVTGVIMIRPRAAGVRQDPPLPVRVEIAPGAASEGLAERIRARLRDKLVVTTEIELTPAGSLPRSEYKSKLVEKTG